MIEPRSPFSYAELQGDFLCLGGQKIIELEGKAT
jgi:hypothetical protein